MPPYYGVIFSIIHRSSIWLELLHPHRNNKRLKKGENVNLWIIHQNVMWEQEILPNRHKTLQMHIFRWSWTLPLRHVNYKREAVTSSKAATGLVRRTKLAESTSSYRETDANRALTAALWRKHAVWWDKSIWNAHHHLVSTCHYRWQRSESVMVSLPIIQTGTCPMNVHLHALALTCSAFHMKTQKVAA